MTDSFQKKVWGGGGGLVNIRKLEIFVILKIIDKYFEGWLYFIEKSLHYMGNDVRKPLGVCE